MGAIITVVDPKCAKTLILHTTDLTKIECMTTITIFPFFASHTILWHTAEIRKIVCTNLPLTFTQKSRS